MVNLVIEERKRQRKKMVLDGYFGESFICDGCVARSISEFKDTHQDIYLITVFLESNKLEKYCFSCAIKEKEKEIKEIKESYYQVKGRPEPEILRCARCELVESDEVEKFRSYLGQMYCMDCFVRLGKVIKDEKETEKKNQQYLKDYLNR